MNDKIRDLMWERKRIEREIDKEIEKEKAKYKFSWKRFLIVIVIFLSPLLCNLIFKLNTIIFPPTSIWSWHYYGL